MAAGSQPASSDHGERSLQRKRYISLIASTLISLAAGTNYVYSAYAPQLASELELSAKEMNLIGTFGNLGMYLMGIPSGIIVDNRGPRLPILMGGFCLLVGYYPMHLAMARGYGSMSVPALCCFSSLTGIGSCFAFGGALKTAALNFPFSRGTATAIALAAFGLSAFFFSSLSSLLFPGDSASFLFLLATLTSGICLLGYFFCRVVPVNTYQALGEEEPRHILHRTRSGSGASGKPRFSNGDDIGTPSSSSSPTSYTFPAPAHAGPSSSPPPPNVDPSAVESSSLFSRSSDESISVAEERRRDLEAARHDLLVREQSGDSGAGPSEDTAVVIADISGWQLFKSSDFWILFTIMAGLAGVGLMTINNIGSDVHLLFAALPPSSTPTSAQIAQFQSLQVSLISLSSCASRVLSGTLSDSLSYRRLPRHICLLISSLLAILATTSGIFITNPYDLTYLSILTGLSYGALFGVAPTIVSETFGVAKMSTNWGALTIGAVVGGNVGNLGYGAVVDRNGDGVGHAGCTIGVRCYREAYLVGLGMAVLGMVVAGLAVGRYGGWSRRGAGGRGRGKSVG